MPSLADDLARQFQENGWTWKIDGHAQIPTAEDIQATLDRAKELLYDEPVPSELEVGRLLIGRYDDHNFAIFLHFGDYND